MAISAEIRVQATVTETLTGDDLVANTQIVHSGYDVSRTYSGTTTPDITKCSFQTVAMTAGAATIDMTALLLNGVAVTLSGLEPRVIRATALTGNAGNITIAKGASNGYDGMGAAFSVTLEPGQSFMFEGTTTGNAVGGANKTLDLSGTLTDGVRFTTVAGT
jgi:hypothetical protein